MLQAIIDDLEENGIGTFGTNIFGSAYPTTAPDECVLVRSSGGPEPSKHLPIIELAVQFLSRAYDYPSAVGQAWAIFDLYHGRVQGGEWFPKHNYSIGKDDNVFVLSSMALQPPSDIGPDEKGRSEVSFNMIFKIRF